MLLISNVQIQATYKDIWNLSFPIIMGSLAQSITQLIDAAFLGRLGVIELGASNLAGMYYTLLILIAIGFTRGGQIIFARRIGEQKKQEVGIAYDQLLIICAVIVLLLGLSISFFNSLILPQVVSSIEVQTGTELFLRIRSYSLPFSIFNASMMAFFTGIGRTKALSYGIIILGIINLFLDYVLIFGHWGFPELGLKGAAWASTIAEISAVIFYLIYLKYRDIISEFQLFKFRKIDRGLISKMTLLSAPLALQNAIGIVAWFSFFLMIEKMGEEALGIATIIKSLYMFIGLPMWSFATAGNSIVSNLLGQQKQEDVLIALKKVVLLSFGFAVITCLIIYLFPSFFIKIYTNDTNLIAKSIPSLNAILIALLLFSIGIPLFQGIMGSGDTKFTLLIETCIVSIYALYAYIIIIKLKIDLSYTWTAEWVYWGLLIIVCIIYLKYGRWRKIKV